jgi:glycosyltransferase involved in cell wall biosynthesis
VSGPSVGVVIPTRGDRPELLRQALAGVLAQRHDGPLEVAVVADAGDPDAVAAQVAGVPNPAGRPVRVLANPAGPHLARARNAGIDALRTDLLAFCDDDDVWLPGKLAAQVAALRAAPGADFASCAIEVEYRGRTFPRQAGRDRVSRADLVRSRMVMVHSSTFLFSGYRVDETAPGGQNEDWDLALRAAARHPIVHVDRPLVRVRWGRSHYAAQWSGRVAGLEWMLARHPELAADRRGAARVYGQLAFLHAALGRRRRALRWAGRALGRRWTEPRVPIALAVASGLVSPGLVLGLLHARGHGI